MSCQHRRLSIDPRDPTTGFCIDCWNTVHVGPVLDIPTTKERARLPNRLKAGVER